MKWRGLTWPQAFVVVFGGFPVFFCVFAVFFSHPLASFSISVVMLLAWELWREARARAEYRRKALELSERAEIARLSLLHDQELLQRPVVTHPTEYLPKNPQRPSTSRSVPQPWHGYRRSSESSQGPASPWEVRYPHR